MRLSCTRLIAVLMIAFSSVQPSRAEEPPAVLTQPQGSVLIRNDPQIRDLLDEALAAAEQGDSAGIRASIAKAEALVGPGRPKAALNQEAAADFAIAGDAEAALAYGSKAVAIGRSLAASYIFYRGMTMGMPAFEQTEPFRDFLSTSHVLMDGDLGQARRLTGEAFKVAQLAHMTKAGLAVLRQQANRSAPAGLRSDEVRLVQMVADMIGPTLQTAREIAAGLHGEAGSPARTRMEALNAGQQKNLQEAISLIAKEKIDIADILLPRPLEADDVARRLAVDEALVFFVEGNMAEIHGFAVTRESIRWQEMSLKLPELEALVSGFRAAIGAPLGRSASVVAAAGGAPPVDDILSPAWQLYQALLGPFQDELRGKAHLIVVADGVLAKLPFEALLTKAPPDSVADYRELPWLVRDHAVTMLPALSAIAARDRGASSSVEPPRAFLGIGNPDYAALAGKTGLISAVRALGTLTPLPDSESEVRRIADMLGASAQDLLLGRNASEETLYALSNNGTLAQYGMLTFATHGLLPGEIDGIFEAALALTPVEKDAGQIIVPSAMGLITSADGLLTTSEIPQLKLDAGIVVLSACNTGAASQIDFEAYSGLASAFLQAGARSVLVSHWPVKSDAAVAITTGTVAHWTSRKPGRDFAFAFREALLHVIKTSPETARPSYWAPFSLFGEP